MSEKGKLSKALLYAPENGFDRLPEGERPPCTTIARPIRTF